MKCVSLSLLLTVLLGGCSMAPLFSCEPPHQLLRPTSSWEINKVWDKEVISGAPITLIFDGAEKISGFSGCNQYTARYSVAGRSLKISGIAATTAHACSTDVMAQEKRLFDVLNMVRWVRPEHNGAITLRLLHEDGDPVELTPART